MLCGCRCSWHSGGPEGAAQMSAVINAVMAVSMGLARHVLVYRTVTESTAQGSGRRQGIGVGAKGIGGVQQWTLPFRAYSAANWLAVYAQRHFHEFGTTREQMAQIALNGRSQRGSESQGRLSGAADDGRLSRRPDDFHAAVPFRLRRAGGRLDCGDWSASRSMPTQSIIRWRGSRRWVPRCAGGRRGISGTTSPRWRRATPRPTCGRAPI